MLWIIHGLLSTLSWLIVIFVRNPRILLIAILWNFLLAAQWLVIGTCIINPIENHGSRYSIMHEWMASEIGIPVCDFTKGFILIMSVSPTCIMAGRVYRALGRKIRRRLH